MIISSNTKQSFVSTTGIKVTQNNSSTNQSKNTEATSLNINSSTLQTLNLLSSLKEETFIKPTQNGYVNVETVAAKNRLNEVYSKANQENKKFANPEQHIRDKYYSISSPYYIEGLSNKEREVAYDHEMDYLKNNKLVHINYMDPNLKDLTAIDGYVKILEEQTFNRDAVNSQFQDLLDKYSIDIPKDTKLTFTIDPYDYKVSVSGSDDKNLTSLIEDVINTGDNSKALFNHIYKSTLEHTNSQISKEKSEKKSVFHEIKDKTGYDLRDLQNVDGKFLTEDGTDILDLYKEGVLKSKDIPEEYKGLIFDSYSSKLSELAKKGFENSPDLVLSIDYKNGSFYDVGQSENLGVGQRDWITTLKASRSETFGEAFKEYRVDDNIDKNEIIKNILNLKELNFQGIKSKGNSLFEKYGNNPELIKLLLMQKYLLGKDIDEKENKDIDNKFLEDIIKNQNNFINES
ncbi:conserved hypothetical protein [Aliarcobacter butzleri JV22]|uniref:DUF4885 family protein n=1 Tax=Aliarcobacter butzleri TaxID=28197 RepID=UPI0001F162AA|nr:DUF4885 family protein [Aliarcobacter butzleri]EFU70911.1 conserved hypothetical protein [Aliarcobacter butzleri JV22]